MSDHVGGLWLVGVGRMGIAYAHVLKAMGVPFRAIGRGVDSAGAFAEATGCDAATGGLQRWLDDADGIPAHAIVAIDVDDLAASTVQLIKAGVKRVLVEKPAGVDACEIAAAAAAADESGADVFVAYNRRFYATADRARTMIADDGGVTSFSFEFTELCDVVARSSFPPRVKQNWFLANSTHVVDLAFFLGGRPARLVARTQGSLSWHPVAARFAGVGETAAGALFSYSADWDAPGRWGLELMTTKRRLILRPMEQLHVQSRGEFAIEPAAVEDELDRRFKPGLYRQVEAFLAGARESDLLRVQDHLAATTGLYTTMITGGERQWP